MPPTSRLTAATAQYFPDCRADNANGLAGPLLVVKKGPALGQIPVAGDEIAVGGAVDGGGPIVVAGHPGHHGGHADDDAQYG
jgi:hypothetical protein